MARPRSHRMTVGQVANDVRVATWYVRWRRTDVTGDRRPVTQWFLTEADAVAFKAKHEGHAAALPPPPALAPPPATGPTGDALAADPGSFHTFAERWLTTIVARKKAATRRSYRGLLETHVYATLGAVPLATIDAECIVGLIAARAAAGVAWGTQKAIIRVLSTCLRWAVRYKHLTHNPCLQLMKELRDDSLGEYEDPEPNPLTADQTRNFLAWLQTGQVPGHPARAPLERRRGGQPRTSYPEWIPYFSTLFLTGMRRGEAAGWRWTSINLAGGRGRLERNYSPSEAAVDAKGDGDVTLKGKRAHDIEIDPDLVPILEQWQRDQRTHSLATGRGKPSPYVFTTARGARVKSDSKTADRVFAAGMKAIGAEHEGHTIHNCRDTFATLHLIKDSGRLVWVSWMLGHRQRSTTANRYAKWVPEWSSGVRIGGDLNLIGAVHLEADAK